MQEKQVCPDCGAPVRRATPAGQCPACLLRLSLSVADGGLAFGLDECPAEEVSASETLNPDSAHIRYVGDYELIEEIGRGGMGVVYKARQVSLNRFVALKLVRAGDFADENEVARFRAEAEAAAHLDHPNIVSIYEVGEHDGRHYFSMKLIEGGSLAERIANDELRMTNVGHERQTAPFDIRHSALVISQVARAVHHAHQRGLLHRDLKPGNILLDAEGQPHITDFGLAKRIDTDSAMTMPGAILGTPGYIAPEQAAGVKQLTTAADIHSLGAILYELLAGRPPFTGATVMETLHNVMNKEPVPPSAVRSSRREEAHSKSESRKPKSGIVQSLLTSAATSVDCDLETICLKCLEKEPARRYGSAEALADDLERWLAHKPIRARPVTFVERLRKWTQRNPLHATGAAALFLVSALGLAGVLWQWHAAVAARRAIQEELWHSQLLDARSYRLSSGPGRRAKALEILERAAAYHPSIELRNEALATLVLPDLGSNFWWRREGNAELPQAFTSDLGFYAGRTGNGQVAVWRGADPKAVTRFNGLGAVGKTMRFSPDDSLLAVKFADGAIGVWNWRDQQLVLQTKSWPDGSDHVPPFDFTPDGREFWLSDSTEQLARYSLPDGQPLPPPAITGRARRLRFDPTGHRLVGWSGRTLTAWDVGTGVQLGEWQAPGAVWPLAWHPGGNQFAVGVFQAGIHVAEIGQTNLVAFTPDADPIPVFTSLGFTPDGTFVIAGGWGNIFAMWNFATRQQESRSRSTWFQQLSRDGMQVAAGMEGQGHGVRALHLPVGIRRLRVPAVLGWEVKSASWHPGGRWLITGHPRGWAVWDASSGQPVRQYEGTTAIQSIRFLPDGTAFFTGGGAGARLWPFAEENGVPQIGPPRVRSPPSAVPNERSALSPDGQRFAAVGDYSWLGSVKGTSAPMRIADGDDNQFVSFSPDGRWLCLSRWTGTHLKIRDALTGAFVTNLPAGTANGYFTPAGDQLVSVLPDRVTFWQTGTWQRLREIPFGDERKHSDIAGIWPDGRCVLTIGPEATLQLWDLEANEEIATLWLPIESYAWLPVFDASAHRMAMPAGRPWVDLWDFPALRRELARLGLDWPGESPSGKFAPRQP